MRKFRQDYVWQEENNKILQMNMEGIMRIFDKFSEPNDKGFTNKSAFKLIKGIGSTVKDKVIQQQFDLSQMTVIDEMHGSDEYADMEFVELLEFIVRYAYVQESDSPDEE